MFGFLLFDDEYDDDGKMGVGWLNCVTKPSPPPRPPPPVFFFNFKLPGPIFSFLFVSLCYYSLLLLLLTAPRLILQTLLYDY